LNKILGLTIVVLCEIDFILKYLLTDSLLTLIVQSGYLNTSQSNTKNKQHEESSFQLNHGTGKQRH